MLRTPRPFCLTNNSTPTALHHVRASAFFSALASFLAFISLAAVSNLGCKNKSAESPATQKTGTESNAATDKAPGSSNPAVSETGPSGSATLLNPASLTATAPAHFTARFTTTTGVFDVRVTRSWAPKGADRFFNLVKNGFFNETGFFRVVPGFVVQFGLSGDPGVNTAWRNATIEDDPVVQGNKRGRVVFAKTGAPNSRTTQIFINLKDNAFLDGMGFAAFGEVEGNGLQTVEAINSEYRERPNQGVIQSQGNRYLKAQFPNLDYVTKAEIL